MTGSILKLLPSICTGKDTYFKASYWQVVAATFERDMTMYFQIGALFSKLSPKAAIMDPAYVTLAQRLQRTRKAETTKSSPPNGTVINFSCKTPYTSKVAMSPPP
jgi:hypothetical protein